LKATVRVRVHTPSPSHARALCSSLEPDNVGFPAGLSMSMKLTGRSLELSFVSDRVTDTLISTVDDVFEACGISLLGISSSQGKRYRCLT
jgi:hypothetical protein